MRTKTAKNDFPNGMIRPMLPKNPIKVREAHANSYGFDLTDEREIKFNYEGLQFTVLDFTPSLKYDRLVTTLRITMSQHVDPVLIFRRTLDLFHQDFLNEECKKAARTLRVEEEKLKAGMYLFAQKLDQYRKDAVNGKAGQEQRELIDPQVQEDANAVLTSDNILECVEGLLKQAGAVTEMDNALRLFFILLTRNFEKPLHVILQGDPHLSRMLLDTVSKCIPASQIENHTSLSGASIYYSRDKHFWRHKVLHLAMIDRNVKNGATLQEFIEHGFVKRLAVTLDHHTRQLHSQQQNIPGPICLAAYSGHDNTFNPYFRDCFILQVNETEKNRKEMTTHIQREAAGMIDLDQQALARKVLQQIQVKLKSIHVRIPFAQQLELPGAAFQPLRSFPQLLTFIKAITLLHQKRLKVKRAGGQEYIEATPEHLETALSLFSDLLLTQNDPLTPDQRRFLEWLKEEVKDPSATFKTAALLQKAHMSRSVFYRAFDVLKERGYVVHAGGNKKAGVEYRISDWKDLEQLQHTLDLKSMLEKIKLGFPEVSQQVSQSDKSDKSIN